MHKVYYGKEDQEEKNKTNNNNSMRMSRTGHGAAPMDFDLYGISLLIK